MYVQELGGTHTASVVGATPKLTEGMDPMTKTMLTIGAILVGGLALVHFATRKKPRKNPHRRMRRRPAPRRARRGGRWIKKAIKRPGAFRAYMQRRYGDRAFTGRGTLKMSYINKVIADPKVSSRVHKQAVLARTLKRI